MNLVRHGTFGSMPGPQAFYAANGASRGIYRRRRCAGRTIIICIRWWDSCTRSSANETLGHGKAGGAIVVKVLAIELIKDWVKHHGLLVNGDNRIGWN